jgi:hypothetical protein
LVDYIKRADKAFRGLGGMTLQIKESAILQNAVSGVESTVLRRLASSGEPIAGAMERPHPAKEGILDRYGTAVISDFEDTLSEGMMARKPWGEMRSDLVAKSPFLQGKPMFWAERIIRTETMNTYNLANLEGMKEAQEQLGDMCKILSATWDDRTSWDSYGVSGQIRRIHEPFSTYYGLMQHPPARPNDREVVVPHRIAWSIPEYLRPKEDAEVLLRWVQEGKKGKPPARPAPMTTIPLTAFGHG